MIKIFNVFSARSRNTNRAVCTRSPSSKIPCDEASSKSSNMPSLSTFAGLKCETAREESFNYLRSKQNTSKENVAPNSKNEDILEIKPHLINSSASISPKNKHVVKSRASTFG